MQAEASARERGLAALRQGDPQEASRLLIDALRANASDAEVCSALGIAFCQQNRVEEGVKALQRAVELAPARAPLRFNLAKGLELGGRQPEALASYEAALQLDPSHTAAREAIQRLKAGAAGGVPTPAFPHASGALADFVLSDSGTAGGHAPAPPLPPVSPNPVPAPSVRYGRPPGPSGPLMPMGAPYHAPAVAPRRSTPWGLIIGIAAAFVVVAIAMTLIVFAVMVPAFQQARVAAQRARARAEMGSQFPSSPGPMGTVSPPGTGHPAAGVGSELDRPGGGGQILDQLFGFSAAFPPGFTAPMPQQNSHAVGTGGTASTQTYRAVTPAGVAYILCYAFSPEVYDQVESQLFNLGQSGLRKSAGGNLRSSATRYQGYAAQDVSYGSTVAGRARLVLARPRLFLIAFESRNRESLAKPGVTAFLNSLRIQDNVSPPSAQSPMQAPGRSRMPPGAYGPRFGPGGPPGAGAETPGIPDAPSGVPTPPSGFPRARFPTSPGGSRPDFTPPDIPRPPTPNLPEIPRPPSFGPGGMRFGPGGGPGGPAGVGGPRFSPPGVPTGAPGEMPPGGQ